MFRRFIFFLWILIQWCLDCFGQVQLSVSISGLPAGTVPRLILEHYDGEGWSVLENVPSQPDGVYRFTKQLITAGEYHLRLTSNPRKWVDFLYLPQTHGRTAKREWQLKYEDFEEKAVLFDTTREDSAYVEMMQPYLLRYSEYAPRYDTEKAKLRAEFVVRETAISVRDKYSETYTARLICPVIGRAIPEAWYKSTPFTEDSLRMWDKATALRQIPFSDTMVVRHVCFVRNMNQLYNTYYALNDLPGFVDDLMPRAMANEKVQAVVFQYLLDKLMDAKDEQALHHLLSEYAEGCGANESLSQSTKNLLLALENCAPGKKIRPLSLPDIEGRRIAMQDIYSKNKVTLILFWRSNCQHCKEFEPLLEEVYGRYKSQGVEVYAIGTDKEEADWKKQLTERTPPWPSVYLSYDSRKDFNKTYPVPSTPTLLAVDSQGTILRRVILRSQLEKNVIQLLELVK